MGDRDSKVLMGLAHLQQVDPILARVIRSSPQFSVRPSRQRFQVLARSIASQQISTKAANSIWKRLETRLGSRAISAQRLASLSLDELRVCGFSARKALYLSELANRVSSSEVSLDKLGRLDDEKVIACLTTCHGIGRWTAQMFLIFGLGRLDVLATDDHGLRQAVKALYQFQSPISQVDFEKIATPWRPYASIASWYCWRYLEKPS